MHATTALAAKAAALYPGADIPKPQAPSFLNTAAIFGLVIFVAIVISLFIGTKVIGKADKQKVNQSAATGANVLIGWGIIIAAMVGVLATWLASALGFFGNA